MHSGPAFEPAFPRAPECTRGFHGSTGLRSYVGLVLAHALVLVVRAVAPLSAFWIVLRMMQFRALMGPAINNAMTEWLGQPFSLQSLDVWCLLEVLFVLATVARAHRHSQRRLPIAFPPTERAAAIGRVIDHIAGAAARTRCIDAIDGSKIVPGRCDDDCPHTLLRGWMHGAPWSTLALPHSQVREALHTMFRHE